MILRQQQPIVVGVFNQTASGLHQPLLQAGQRPVADRRGQRQPAPQIPEVIGDDTQPEPHLVGAEAVTGKPRHRDRLLAFLYPLFRRAALVVEAHRRPVVERQLVTTNPTRGNNSPQWNSTFATTRRACFQLAA